jgi:hypothetical protein
MKYYLENVKNYLIYMYHLIKGRDSLKILNKQFSKLNIDDKRLFIEGMEYNSQFDFQSSKVLNNKWGEWKLKKQERYNQALFEDGNKIGWEYITPNKNRGVIGYPEMFTGKSPFGGESNSEHLPKKIDDIQSLVAAYNVSMYLEPKKYNLAFDLWVTKNGKNETSDISHEIMIWEDRNVAMPAGKFKGEVRTSSGTYRMYHTWMDRTSENLGTDGWYFTAFVRKEGTRSNTVNLKEFIYIMLLENILDEKHFISTVEFGNEIYNACGYTIVNDYKLNIK